MKKVSLIIFLSVFLFYGCKKDNLNNGTLTLQVQGSSAQTFTMPEMGSAFLYTPNPFCDSCLFPGTQLYHVVCGYDDSAQNNGAMVHMGLRVQGFYTQQWADTPSTYFFYNFLKIDTLPFTDSTAYAFLGAALTYVDQNGMVWDSRNGPLYGYNLKISSVSSLETASSKVYARIGGSFTCNLYNTSGTAKSVTGTYSNIAVQISH